MPVRIYDISKKLGLDNKAVLTKAKSLGIAAARVASSSLDKITAEYLEQQIILDHPELVAPPPPPPPPPPAPPAVEPVAAIAALPPEPQAAQRQEVSTPAATIVVESHLAPAAGAAPPVEAQTASPATAIDQPSAEPALEPVAKTPPSPLLHLPGLRWATRSASFTCQPNRLQELARG